MQSLAGNLSMLLLVHCLTDAGWPGFAWFQGNPTTCHALVLEITSFHCLHAKTHLSQGLKALMLEDLCSKGSGRSTNPRPSWLPLLSGASSRRLDTFGVKLVGCKAPHSFIAPHSFRTPSS